MASCLKDLRDSVLRHSAAGFPSPRGSESPKSVREHSIERTAYFANAWQRQCEAAPDRFNSPSGKTPTFILDTTCRARVQASQPGERPKHLRIKQMAALT